MNDGLGELFFTQDIIHGQSSDNAYTFQGNKEHQQTEVIARGQDKGKGKGKGTGTGKGKVRVWAR